MSSKTARFGALVGAGHLRRRPGELRWGCAAEGGARAPANSSATMQPLERYFNELASAAPVPGGGSAAAVVTSAGAALVGMVARICADNPKYAEHASLARRLAAESDRLVAALGAARERDERAFAAVVAAQTLPKVSSQDKAVRASVLQRALLDAAREPLEAAALARAALHAAAELLVLGNPHLASDVGCAAEFAYAGLTAYAYNVRVNHRYIKDAEAIARQQIELAACEAGADEELARVRAAVGTALRG